jgi:hypothetical protein
MFGCKGCCLSSGISDIYLRLVSAIFILLYASLTMPRSANTDVISFIRKLICPWKWTGDKFLKSVNVFESAQIRLHVSCRGRGISPLTSFYTHALHSDLIPNFLCKVLVQLMHRDCTLHVIGAAKCLFAAEIFPAWS